MTLSQSPTSPSVNGVSQEPTHAPGPWSVIEVGDRIKALAVMDSTPQSVLTIITEDSVDFAAVLEEADAHLIAAAPDLLDAAKLGLSIAKSWIDQEMIGTAHTEAMRALGPIRAAIVRASGEKT